MYAGLIIPIHEFEKMRIGDLLKPFNEKLVALKVITGYTYDNPHTYFEDGHGNLFKFLFIIHNKPKNIITFSINLYTQTGVTILNEFIFEKHSNSNWHLEIIPKDVVVNICKTIDDYNHGKIKCADCGEIVDKKDGIGGHYFASAYCKGCWKGEKGNYKDRSGWSAVEAKENYN